MTYFKYSLLGDVAPWSLTPSTTLYGSVHKQKQFQRLLQLPRGLVFNKELHDRTICKYLLLKLFAGHHGNRLGILDDEVS